MKKRTHFDIVTDQLFGCDWRRERNYDKSFNKLKNQIMEQSKEKEQDEVIDAIRLDPYDKAFNNGVQQAIDVCKQQEMLYNKISPNSSAAMALNVTISLLEYLKK
jgi:hypothetical protein